MIQTNELDVVVPLVYVLRPWRVLRPASVALRTEGHHRRLLVVHPTRLPANCPHELLAFSSLLDSMLLVGVDFGPGRRAIESVLRMFKSLIDIRVFIFRFTECKLFVCLSHCGLCLAETKSSARAVDY